MRECLRGWRDLGVKNGGGGEKSQSKKQRFGAGKQGVWGEFVEEIRNFERGVRVLQDKKSQ
jgi:hypothetical protein